MLYDNMGLHGESGAKMVKRYKTVSCVKHAEKYAVLLDGKPARTPSGEPLLLPSQALAQAVAHEWQSQGKVIRKNTMPLTQIACIAIDLVGRQREKVAEDLLGYIDTDLVCFRAGDVPDLVRQQGELLDPVLAWAKERFGVQFLITGGVMPLRQPADIQEKLSRALASYDDWKLAALAAAVKPLGSLILGLALTEGHINAQAAFMLSQLEESYETARWGIDEEKEAKRLGLASEIESAERLLHLLLSSGN
jgi:chaperone required for assembly of F1-ATPase